MVTDKTVEQLLNSLAFEVEAIPDDNDVQLKSSSNMAPLNVKIRVRKKHDADSQSVGVIALPKPSRSDNAPERLRLASSDQTIMSFNMIMETDLQTHQRKQKKLLGKCFGSQYDGDDNPYMPNSSGSNSVSRSESVVLSKKMKSKNYPDDIAPPPNKKQKRFFGKCKPGGCLDPPFGEDKYPYLPKDQLKFPQNNINIEKSKLIETEPKKLRNGNEMLSTTKTEPVVSIPPKVRNGNKRPSTTKIQDLNSNAILSLYEIDSFKTQVEERDSDSIITYPPNSAYNGIIIKDELYERNINSKRNSSSTRSRKSFEINAPYYIPSTKDRETGISKGSEKGKTCKYSTPPKTIIEKEINSKDTLLTNIDKTEPQYYTVKEEAVKGDALVNTTEYEDIKNKFDTKPKGLRKSDEIIPMEELETNYGFVKMYEKILTVKRIETKYDTTSGIIPAEDNMESKHDPEAFSVDDEIIPKENLQKPKYNTKSLIGDEIIPVEYKIIINNPKTLPLDQNRMFLDTNAQNIESLSTSYESTETLENYQYVDINDRYASLNMTKLSQDTITEAIQEQSKETEKVNLYSKENEGNEITLPNINETIDLSANNNTIHKMRYVDNADVLVPVDRFNTNIDAFQRKNMSKQEHHADRDYDEEINKTNQSEITLQTSFLRHSKSKSSNVSLQENELKHSHFKGNDINGSKPSPNKEELFSLPDAINLTHVNDKEPILINREGMDNDEEVIKLNPIGVKPQTTYQRDKKSKSFDISLKNNNQKYINDDISYLNRKEYFEDVGVEDHVKDKEPMLSNSDDEDYAEGHINLDQIEVLPQTIFSRGSRSRRSHISSKNIEEPILINRDGVDNDEEVIQINPIGVKPQTTYPRGKKSKSSDISLKNNNQKYINDNISYLNRKYYFEDVGVEDHIKDKKPMLSNSDDEDYAEGHINLDQIEVLPQTIFLRGSRSRRSHISSKNIEEPILINRDGVDNDKEVIKINLIGAKPQTTYPRAKKSISSDISLKINNEKYINDNISYLNRKEYFEDVGVEDHVKDKEPMLSNSDDKDYSEGHININQIEVSPQTIFSRGPRSRRSHISSKNNEQTQEKYINDNKLFLNRKEDLSLLDVENKTIQENQTAIETSGSINHMRQPGNATKKIELFRLENSIVSTLPMASPSPSIVLNLAFQSNKNDNKKVIRTLDSTMTEDNQYCNVIIVRTHLKSNGEAITVPIDSESRLCIMIKKSLLDQKCHDKAKQNACVEFDSDAINEENRKEVTAKHPINNQIVHNVLASIYEKELVPLHQVIQNMKDEIDALAEQQTLFRNKMLSARKMKPTRSLTSIKRDGCPRKCMFN